MKKLLFIFYLIVLFSCEKSSDECWACYAKNINTGYVIETYIDTPCKMSDNEMYSYRLYLSNTRKDISYVECLKSK